MAIMDIGTNTELIVGNRDRILAASCPAGPAFEGGAIACGMPGARRRDRDVSRSTTTATFALGVIGDGAARGHLRLGPRRSDERAAPHRPDERDGPLRGRRSTASRSTREHGIYFLESDVNELAQAKGANVAGPAGRVQQLRHRLRRHRRVLPGRRLRPAPATSTPSQRIGLIPQSARREDRAGRQRRDRRRAHRAALASEARRSWKRWCKRVEHCRLETHPALLRFLRRRLPVQAGRIRRDRGGADDRARRHTRPDVDVAAGRVHAAARLSARTGCSRAGPRELADWARDVVRRARPAVGLRPPGASARRRRRRRSSSTAWRFASARLRRRCRQAEAHSAVLVAVSAGAGARSAKRSGCGSDEKPDEYFFLEVLRLGRRRASGHDDRRAAVRLGRDAAAGRAAALQPRLSGVGHRRAAAAAAS